MSDQLPTREEALRHAGVERQGVEYGILESAKNNGTIVFVLPATMRGWVGGYFSNETVVMYEPEDEDRLIRLEVKPGLYIVRARRAGLFPFENTVSVKSDMETVVGLVAKDSLFVDEFDG